MRKIARIQELAWPCRQMAENYTTLARLYNEEVNMLENNTEQDNNERVIPALLPRAREHLAHIRADILEYHICSRK
jgi:hypothetical protein